MKSISQALALIFIAASALMIIVYSQPALQPKYYHPEERIEACTFDGISNLYGSLYFIQQ